MYPTHLLFTTNVNLHSGEKIKLSDSVTINDHFIKRFKSAPYIDRDPQASNKELATAVEEYVNSINPSVLIQGFNNADLPNLNGNQYGIFSYFQYGALIISMQVSHVIGDHAEFKIELE